MAEEMSTPEQRKALSAAQRKTRKEIERRNSALERLDIQYIRVDGIKPNPWNPNRQSEHDFELLLRSMEEDGFTQPVVAVRITEEDLEVDRIKEAGYLVLGDIMIVDGEHRWRAGTKLGFEEIPVVITPMTAAQAMIATLRHNRARGSEDIGLAADVLRDLQTLGVIEWAQDSLMLDDVELNRLLDDIDAPTALADEEFAASWEPDTASGAEEGQALSTSTETGEAPSGQWSRAASASAVEAQRERETQIAQAHTDEQKAMIRKETAKEFHRVSLIFAGEDAEIVKEVLGGAAAETLVQLCREKIGAEAPLKEQGWVSLDGILGMRMIPAEAGAVFAQAIKKMEDEGVINSKNRFQVIEYLSAEYLGGA